MNMKQMFTTKEVADFLNVNEKMIYSLVSDKGLPASKITGKWLFPRHLVEQWVENNTLNIPENGGSLPPYEGLLIIVGSNDPLLDQAISMFNDTYAGQVAVFGNLGSMGGLRALRQNHCHMATCHLLEEDESDYNFDFARQELEKVPVVVTFCRREQGLLIKKGNPKKIESVKDLAAPGITIANRSLSTGTRHLFDRELKKAGIVGDKIRGYRNEVNRHVDVGLEILAGRVDAGPCIRSVAAMLDLDFIPLRWERYDLLIMKERFFDQGVQNFLSILHEKRFKIMASELKGYDYKTSGRMVFPTETE